ncbi:MAG: hypothetical protein KME13_10650 [Myxacorys californica WJT36-NPBG1]|jgi:hypothetical protein|nr:hypothetical protein [Myxacorys californica WJT36-NPBG1]
MLSGCSLASNPTPVLKPSTQLAPLEAKVSQLDIANVVGGYWVTEKGQLISPIQGRIYGYDWYAIKLNQGGKVTLTWDDGLNCTKTEGQIKDNKLKLKAGDVETELVVHDRHRATIAFCEGKTTYVKQLVKQREDAKVICQ